jgi:hypothetical protein
LACMHQFIRHCVSWDGSWDERFYDGQRVQAVREVDGAPAEERFAAARSAGPVHAEIEGSPVWSTRSSWAVFAER